MAALHIRGTGGKVTLDLLDMSLDGPGKPGLKPRRVPRAGHLARPIAITKRLVLDSHAGTAKRRKVMRQPLRAAAACGQNKGGKGHAREDEGFSLAQWVSSTSYP